MFQRIQTQAEYMDTGFGSRIGNLYSGKYKTYHKIIDTDFESEEYCVENTEYLFVRMIIHEYSKRQLNVAANLKIYYQALSTQIPRMSYRQAIHQLCKEQNTINNYYEHLHFNNYIPCILRHFKRMQFVGLLK